MVSIGMIGGRAAQPDLPPGSGVGAILSPEWGWRPGRMVPTVGTARVRRVDRWSRARLQYVIGSANGKRVAK